MYLVEYVKILKRQNKKCCSCFYTANEALEFSKKLANCRNIKSVELSVIDFNKLEIIYKHESFFCKNDL